MFAVIPSKFLIRTSRQRQLKQVSPAFFPIYTKAFFIQAFKSYQPNKLFSFMLLSLNIFFLNIMAYNEQDEAFNYHTVFLTIMVMILNDRQRYRVPN